MVIWKFNNLSTRYSLESQQIRTCFFLKPGSSRLVSNIENGYRAFEPKLDKRAICGKGISPMLLFIIILATVSLKSILEILHHLIHLFWWRSCSSILMGIHFLQVFLWFRQLVYQVVQPFVFYSLVDPQFVGILGGRNVFRHGDDCLFVAIFLPWKWQGIGLTQHLTALVYILAYFPSCMCNSIFTRILWLSQEHQFWASWNVQPWQSDAPFPSCVVRDIKVVCFPVKRENIRIAC